MIDTMKAGLMIYTRKANSLSSSSTALGTTALPMVNISDPAFLAVAFPRSSSSSSSASNDIDSQKFMDTIDKVLVLFDAYVNSVNSANAITTASQPQGSSSTSKATSSTTSESHTAANEEMYVAAMRPLQYVEVDNFESFHYQQHSNFSSKSRIRRLAQDHSDLSCNGTSLLCWSSSVWVRSWSSRMDCMRVMIGGPDGTPYSNGLFIFDVYFPDT
jgi:hypothetical protein